jgi:hypothetical protein
LNNSLKITSIILIVSVLIASSTIIILIQNTPRLTVNGAQSVDVLPAQVTWQKRYGGETDDRAFYGLKTSEGFLVVGSTKSIVPNATVAWVLKLNEQGNAEWNKTFPGQFGSEFRYVLNLTDGFLLIGNQFSSTGDTNGYVVKIDVQGNVVWNATFGENKTDRFFSGIATPDSYVLFGLAYSNGSNESNALIIKLDINGNVLWNRNYEIGANTVARTGVLAPDSNYVIAGYTNFQNSSNYEFLLLKMDQAGNLIWNQTYAVAGSQIAYSMTQANDGYLIVGYIESPQTDIDARVIKVDWNGTLLWSESIGGKNADSAAVIEPSDDGNYLVAGFTFSFGAGNRDFWLFKISTSGKILWTCTQGDEGYQEAYQIIQTDKNHYVLVGWTDPPGQPALIGKAKYDFYIVKIEHS